RIGTIVLDAGHGGSDTGAIGPAGLMEKDVVLDITRRLAALIRNRPGTSVICTRPDDSFVPLQDRTAIANNQRANLFLSIHANSSQEAATSGAEAYYLNITTSRASLDIAER